MSSKTENTANIIKCKLIHVPWKSDMTPCISSVPIPQIELVDDNR